MDPVQSFSIDRVNEIADMGRDASLKSLSMAWFMYANAKKYSYHFDWMGRPIIQYPQDIVAVQEIIWNVKPDLIIETGIAHGGSLIMSASMLSLLDYCDAVEANVMLDPSKPKRRVLGVDIDIRSHNRQAIENHPMSNRIDMIQGSSIDETIVEQVRKYAAPFKRVLVSLDSNHTHDHVLAELHAYAPLVSSGSYCIVFDTVIEDLPKSAFPDRSWGPGNSPKSAVFEYLKDNGHFTIDESIDSKVLLSVAPMGYLRRS